MHDLTRPAHRDQRGRARPTLASIVWMRRSPPPALAALPGRRRGWPSEPDDRSSTTSTATLLGHETVDEVRTDEPGTADHQARRSARRLGRLLGGRRLSWAGTRSSITCCAGVESRRRRRRRRRESARRGDAAHHHGVLHDHIIADARPGQQHRPGDDATGPRSRRRRRRRCPTRRRRRPRWRRVDAVAAAHRMLERSVVAPGESIEVRPQQQLRAVRRRASSRRSPCRTAHPSRRAPGT